MEEFGPVGTTHDEAVAVARLARERGWKRAILVSDPSHLRRAAALFRKAGLAVLCTPSQPPEYAYPEPRTPEERTAAFRDWLYETYHYQRNRMAGWL